MRFITGSPCLVDCISVKFAANEGSEAISASTCSRRLTLSTHAITEGGEDIFLAAMKAVIGDTSFTMP